MPSPCERRGFNVGDYFVVKDISGACFPYGSLVKLVDDDGTTIPLFREEGGPTEKFLVVDSDVSHVGSYPTPAARAGIGKDMTVYVKSKRPLTIGAEVGDEIKLHHDDQTSNPLFTNITKGKACIVNVSDVSLSPVSEEKNDELFEDKPHEEEDIMTNYPDTPAGRMKLREGDEVRMINREDELEVGHILTLENDDDSSCPFFKRRIKDGGGTFCPWLENVEKVGGEQEEIVNQHVAVTVGGPVKRNDVIFRKDGDVTTADRDQDEPDIDDEYSTQGGYTGVSEIHSIVRFLTPKVRKTEITIEVSEETAKRLRRTGDVLNVSDIRNVSPDFCESVVEVVRAVASSDED